jgi:hypothetical protein
MIAEPTPAFGGGNGGPPLQTRALIRPADLIN